MEQHEFPDRERGKKRGPGRRNGQSAARPTDDPMICLTVDAHERPKRDFLTLPEVDRLVEAARKGRYGTRDAAMVLLAVRHGLRASELVSLQLADLDLEGGRVWVNRLKRGLSTSQPLAGDELRAIRAYLRARRDTSPWAFLSSQGGPLTRRQWQYLVAEAGKRAGLGRVHPHMLRHSCGHILADQGADTRLLQDYLGHRDIRHTALYSRTASRRFNSLWGRR